MTREEDSVVRFLAELGVFDDDDIKSMQRQQGDSIVSMMVRKKALSRLEAREAAQLVTELVDCSNETKRLKAQMRLVKMVTSNVHRRMATCGDKVRANKERLTSGNYPVIAPALAKSSGD